MLLPKSMTANPEVFNKGQLDRPGPVRRPVHRSPTLDRTAQRITLTRNPKWWGTPPLLDSITYLVLDDAARIPALQNNTIDATGVASLPELTTARNTAGISIRRAPGAELVSLHVQRGAGFDPGGQGAAAGGRQGHRPAGHRQRHPARPGRQAGAAEQPHLRRGPGGLPGQQRRRWPSTRRRPNRNSTRSDGASTASSARRTAASW